MSLLSSWKIEKINLDDNIYPTSLREISNPPEILYFRGKLPQKEEKCFSIVGTRKCSNYGKGIAFLIAKQLSQSGLTVVSGMARGIDSFSHKGCLEVKGKTIAVLGTGLDERSVYPKENLRLAKEILESGGCLISEYAPGTRGTKFTFPQRNRIIAGLSLGVLVVEAPLKSGALITAAWAKKQKKKIFAIPGPIRSKNSQGCHFLIKNGALLVESPEDILKALNLPIAEKRVIKGETKEENLILECLKKENLHIDKIIKKTNLSPRVVSATLSLMEIEGKVKNLGENIFTTAQ